MRLAIAGGGTGGHVTPALAVGEAARESSEAVLFLGARRGLETRLVPEAGFDLVALDARPLVGRGPLERARALLALAAGTLRAARVLRRFRADVVVAVGGYASVAPALAARLLRVPVVLVNTDAEPGMANRLVGRFAARILVGFASARDAFLQAGRTDDEVRIAGIPLRARLLEAFADTAGAAIPAATEGGLQLFAFGGSQGARQINDALLAVAGDLADLGIRVVHQTGETDRERVAEGYAKAGVEAEVVSFEHDMPGRYLWCDLVICRAGSLSIAELMLAGRPAILLPLPHVGGGEQFANAAELEKLGAARVLDTRDLDPCALRQPLRELSADREALREMGRRGRSAARPGAAADIVREARQLAEARA